MYWPGVCKLLSLEKHPIVPIDSSLFMHRYTNGHGLRINPAAERTETPSSDEGRQLVTVHGRSKWVEARGLAHTCPAVGQAASLRNSSRCSLPPSSSPASGIRIPHCCSVHPNSEFPKSALFRTGRQKSSNPGFRVLFPQFMDIDPDISRWILEFLLRNPLDDGTSNALIRILPVNDNLGLKKTVLLRGMESEVSNGSVTEKMLGLLEKFEELEFQEGNQALEELKAAYCSVAVDCTVRFLKKNGGEESSRGEYFSAVRRIWRQRICRMEKADTSGLVSEELGNWRDAIEAAVWEDSFCDNVIKRSEEVDAVEAVQVFVKEAKDRMGSSFLEYTAEMLTNDNNLRELLLSENREDKGETDGKNDNNMRELLPLENGEEQGEIGGNDAALPSASQDTAHHNNGRELRHSARKHTKAPLVGISRGAKIADRDDLRAEAHKQYDLPASPEVNKAQEALETSFMELRAVVKDPLPDALLEAAAIMCQLSRPNMDDQPIQENASKRSLMERNSTAHVHEWNDSFDNLPEVSGNREIRPQLPTPERRNISPLKKYEINRLTKRRKAKKWSLVEEDTLRTGVERYGKGNWKLILHAYRGIFEERTEVDLKDKWRNMSSS
nr:Telomeric repeat-binding factor like [Ipomoea batatas]